MIVFDHEKESVKYTQSTDYKKSQKNAVYRKCKVYRRNFTKKNL